MHPGAWSSTSREMEGSAMSLRPEPIGTIPAETARVARAAFPKGTVVMRLRDEFGALYEDGDFAALYPSRGQSGLPPWRLGLVTGLPFLEHLSDRQAADAVRARIDWKYALGLELTDRGFHFSALAEFRARLVAGGAEHLLLDRMLERFKARGLVKARGKQRTDSTHVLAAVHDLHLLELVAETLRAALDDLAAIVPDWLRTIARPDWFERYGRRVEDYRLPKGRAEREALALAVGADGFALLDALDAPEAPAAAREVPMVATLRDVWRGRHARGGGGRAARRVGGALRAGGGGGAALAGGGGAAPGGRAPPVALRPRGALQHQAAHGVVGLQGARHRDLRRGCRAPGHARADLPGDATRHGEHCRHPPTSGRQGPAAGRALRGLGLRRRGAAGRQSARPRRLARGAGAGRGEPAHRRGAGLRATRLHDRLGARAGHLPAGQGVGDLACRPGRGRRPAHPGRVQPHRLRRLRRPGAVHAGEGRASLGLLPPAPGVRGAERGAVADARPRVEAALPRPRRRRGHALARRAGLRDAPEPLHRPGQDRTAAGLHGRRDERLARGELAGRGDARQDARDALRGPGPSRLNSPTVSQLPADRRGLAVPGRRRGPGDPRDRRVVDGRPPPGRAVRGRLGDGPAAPATGARADAPQ